MKRLFVYTLVFMLTLLNASSPSFGMPPKQAVPQAQSVYKINIFTKQDHNPVGSGTGWIAQNKEDKIVVVTNSHVCVDDTVNVDPEVGELVALELEDGRKLKSRIWDPFSDICVLEILGDSSKEIPLHLAKEENKARDPVIVIGHPEGGPLKATIGYRIDTNLVPMGMMDVDYVDQMGEMDTCLILPPGSSCLYFRSSDTLKVDIRPGSSGSPVINMDGEVVEMIWGHYSLQDVSLAVKLDQLARYLK